MVHLRWRSLDLICIFWVQGFAMEEGELLWPLKKSCGATHTHTHIGCVISWHLDILRKARTGLSLMGLNEEISPDGCVNETQWTRGNVPHHVTLSIWYRLTNLLRHWIGSKWFLTFWHLVRVPIHKWRDCENCAISSFWWGSWKIKITLLWRKCREGNFFEEM